MNQKLLAEKISVKKGLCSFIRVSDAVLTVSVYISFVAIVMYEFSSGVRGAICTVVVCAIPFLVLSFFRRMLNFPRPYEVYGFSPLIDRKTVGKSFPSRHAFSSTVIACIAFKISVAMGVCLAVVSLLICVVRYVSGLHFLRDLMCGAIIGLTSGIMGLFILHSVF